MLGFPISRVWIYVWKFVTPGLLLFALGFMIYELEPLSYGDYVFPSQATGFGWFLTAVSLGPTFVYFGYSLIKTWSRSTTNATGLFKLGHVLKEHMAVDEHHWHPATARHQLVDVKVNDIDVIDDVFA